MSLSRRQLLALTTAGLAVPAPLFGGGVPTRQKFLFVFCPGGWDPTYVFAPLWDTVGVDMPPDDSQPARIGDFNLVDSASRPSVRTFFEAWGERTVMVHGVAVPSVAHDVCRRIMMTGLRQGTRDGWDALIASATADDAPMPLVHLSGPIYARDHAAAVVRMGNHGQLAALLKGTALAESDMPVRGPSLDVQELQLSYVQSRAASAVAAAGPGWALRQAEAQALALTRLRQMMSEAESLSLSADDSFAQQGFVIGEVFERGLGRCAMLAYEGPEGQGWDTHTENDKQSRNFEGLFDGLDQILGDLASRSGEAGSLLEETTVVVLSEMGRDPRLNTSRGKEHWPWTTALLVGGGLRGGQTIGGWSDSVSGEPIDLESGEISAAGASISTEHLGATLLALAGVDPAEFAVASPPIAAALA